MSRDKTSFPRPDPKILAALKKENARLQKRIVTLKAECISKDNKIEALEKELRKRPSLAEALSRLPGMQRKRRP